MVSAAPTAWFVALLGIAGCAMPRPEATPPIASRDLLTGEEIRGTTATDAFEAILLLRPGYLRRHGVSYVDSSPVVYIDGIRASDPREAHGVRAAAIADIVFLNPRDATIRYGTGHTGGAVLISTKRSPGSR